MIKTALATSIIALVAMGMPAASQAEEVIVAAQTFSQPAIQKVLDDFGYTKETGNTVKFDSASAGDEDIAKLTTAFRGNSSPDDVIMASDEEFASFVGNGWFAPLDEVFNGDVAKDFSDQMSDAIAKWSQKDGHTYRIPLEFAFSIYWTRDDLLKQYGMAAPKSWDDLKANAKIAKDHGMYGFADALGKGAFGYVYLANLAVQAGGDPFACDASLKTAIDWTKQMMDAGYFPKEAITWTYDQLNQQYLDGKLLTIREWPFFWSVTRDNKAFYAPGKAEVVLPPQGPANGKVWTGGHGWAVPAAAPHLDAAKTFVKFITRPDVQIALAKQNSFFVVPRKSLLAEMKDDAFVKIMNEYLAADRFAPRPFFPQLVAAQGVVEDAAHAYWTGQMSLDDAMAFCKSQIAALSQ